MILNKEKTAVSHLSLFFRSPWFKTQATHFTNAGVRHSKLIIIFIFASFLKWICAWDYFPAQLHVPKVGYPYILLVDLLQKFG
jgi:hypothetical protein